MGKTALGACMKTFAFSHRNSEDLIMIVRGKGNANSCITSKLMSWFEFVQ